MTDLDPRDAARFAELLLAALHREYPNAVSRVLLSDGDLVPPRRLTPAFFGCFDWHSAVHSHWALARLVKLAPNAPFAARARRALAKSFSEAHLIAELEHLTAPGRERFELPYGLAWLLQLAAELDECNDADARAWRDRVRPLEDIAAERLIAWFDRLTYPVRSGEHTQTAFALGLALDWARTTGKSARNEQLAERARALFSADHDGALHLEPSGHDFLSPCLAEADVMRRVLEPEPFAEWLTAFVPTLTQHAALEPVRCPDPSDGKLAHLDGLNLSRAWMLQGIAHGLPASDARAQALESAWTAHARAGLDAVTGEHYAGAHWLGSFAVYYLTKRGLF